MTQEESESSCNFTAYSEWHNNRLENTDHLPLSLHQLRSDLLRVDRDEKEIWRVMNFEESHDDFVKLYAGRRPKRLNITNFQAMTVSTVWCRDNLQRLKDSSAGGHGPPLSGSYSSNDYHGNFLLTVHDAMCMNYCLSSDTLRAEAMSTSQCDCLDLSTKEGDISYTREGDFCLKNSGHLLCEKIELDTCNKCEDLSDFSCARREYDAVNVPLRGNGYECSGAMMLISHSLLVGFAYLAAAFLLFR